MLNRTIYFSSILLKSSSWLFLVVHRWTRFIQNGSTRNVLRRTFLSQERGCATRAWPCEAQINRGMREERENRKHAEEDNTCNFSSARDDLRFNDQPALPPLLYPYGTYNLLNCIGECNEEKWSSVTNGRTLILIVFREIYLSDTRVRLIFETLSCGWRVYYNCRKVHLLFKTPSCDLNARRWRPSERSVGFPHLQPRPASPLSTQN